MGGGENGWQRDNNKLLKEIYSIVIMTNTTPTETPQIVRAQPVWMGTIYLL